MYYKIENKESKIYKDLHQLRTSEIKMKKENLKSIDDKIRLKFKTTYGHHGQQNFNRVSTFSGFEFTEIDKIDLKIWKEDLKLKGIYVPNTRTKLGREMQEFLLNGLQSSNYRTAMKILELEDVNRFTFPFVEICDNATIVAFVGETQEPKSIHCIEITKKEFNKLLE